MKKLKLSTTSVIGYLATVVGTFLMLPQVMHVAKTHSARDVSLGMTCLYVINCWLWLTYGMFLKKEGNRNVWPIIVANMIALVIGVIQVLLVLKYQ